MPEVFCGYELPIKLFRDGDQWCALLGNDLQDGFCGFGDTMTDAVKELEARLNHASDRSPKS